MSRSYKKYPIVRQERVETYMANRYLRHNLDIELPPKGSHFKKVKNFGWRWAYYWSLEDAKKNYYQSKWAQTHFLTLEEYLIYYKKMYLSK